MGESEQKRIFDEWLKEHKGLFFKFVRAYAFTENDRDDLFQEIAIQVWRSIPNFKGNAAVTTWIYRITINTALAWSRKEKKHQEGRSSLVESEHLLKEANQPDPRLDWLYNQISGLNDVDRTLTLLLLDGFSYKEMSKIIGISESNVGVKINRIKKVLITKSQEKQNHGI
jgi:RNA polymerase sigma-70 factor (ECF subfamily)